MALGGVNLRGRYSRESRRTTQISMSSRPCRLYNGKKIYMITRPPKRPRDRPIQIGIGVMKCPGTRPAGIFGVFDCEARR